MKLPISNRLLTCARLIHPGERVADVGTDHGYLPIYLRANGLASYVYAADVAPLPLNRAKENLLRFGVTDGVAFYLCDGVRGLPRDFNTLVIAGLGAETMVRILEGGPWLRNGGYRLVLQCQSSQNELRAYLSESGWRIAREIPVREGKFIYTVMEVLPGQSPLTPGQHFVSPALLESGSPLAVEYLRFCKAAAEKVVSGLPDRTGEKYHYYAQVLEELTQMEERL